VPSSFPANLKGGAAHKVVAKLLTEGLVEEIRARGELPVWRRDDAEGAFALRITKRGLKAIQVEDAPDAEGTEAADEENGSRTKPRRTRGKTRSSKPGHAKKSRKAAATAIAFGTSSENRRVDPSKRGANVFVGIENLAPEEIEDIRNPGIGMNVVDRNYCNTRS
jgi:hypothetical protein